MNQEEENENQNRRLPEDGIVSNFVEALYDFLSKRLVYLSKSAKPIKGKKEYGFEIEKELSVLPKTELQETLVDLILQVGIKTLDRPSCIRMRYLLFSVLVFCIKQSKEGEYIADLYFVVIIRLFRAMKKEH